MTSVPLPRVELRQLREGSGQVAARRARTPELRPVPDRAGSVADQVAVAVCRRPSRMDGRVHRRGGSRLGRGEGTGARQAAPAPLPLRPCPLRPGRRLVSRFCLERPLRREGERAHHGRARYVVRLDFGLRRRRLMSPGNRADGARGDAHHRGADSARAGSCSTRVSRRTLSGATAASSPLISMRAWPPDSTARPCSEAFASSPRPSWPTRAPSYPAAFGRSPR